MTREEAINQLKDFIILHREQHGWDVSTLDALDMAIKTLEHEPCGDCISRQAVLDIAKTSKSNWIDNSVLFKRVSELPSVEPERKFIEKVLETLREMDDAVDVICNLDVDAVLDRMDVE